MMNLKITLIFPIIFFVTTLFSQDSISKPPLKTDKVSLGIGYGIDHGGFGVNLTYFPIQQIGLFGGLGSPKAGIAYTAGIKLRPITKKHTSLFVPVLLGMYDYNASVFVVNASEFNKIFNGYSFGLGADEFRKLGKHSYFSAYFLFPIYKDEVNIYINDCRRCGVVFNNSLPDITFSIGFRFIIE